MLKFDETGIGTRINDVLIGSMDEIPLIDSNFEILSSVEKATFNDRPIFVYDIHEENSRWRYRVTNVDSVFIRVEVLLYDGTETKDLFSIDYLIDGKEKYFYFTGIRHLVRKIPYVSSFYPRYRNDKDVLEYVHSLERLMTEEIKNLYNTNKEIVKDKEELGYYYITEQAKLSLKVFNGIIDLYESDR